MWWKSAKIYELYIDKFAGNIRGLIERLDYFPALGIDTHHILPHYPSPMVDDGYDIVDYRGVRKELGTPDDFKELLAQAHARGLRIIVDFVLNHTSRLHPWFLEARASKHNPKRSYYLWSTTGEEFAAAENPFPDMKPRNWIYNSDTDDYYFATYYPGQPDLNWDNEEVFNEMVGNMEWWAHLGVDGFRLDAVPHLIKREGTTCVGLPETHEVIRRIRARLESRYPSVILLAEAHQTPSLTKTYFGKGDECHLAYHFPLMEALWMAAMERAQGKPLEAHARIQKMLADTADIPANCQWATFLRNHDEISLATLPSFDREALVGWLDPEHRYPFRKGQTTSVRIATAMRGQSARILEIFASLYRAPGAPIMYYGDEIGMTNSHAMEFMLDTRRHVRGAFNWEEAEHQMKDRGSLWSAVSLLIKSSRPEGDTAFYGESDNTHLQRVRTSRAGHKKPRAHGKNPDAQPHRKDAPGREGTL